MNFSVKEKTGFVCAEKVLSIFDKNGLPFYERKNNSTLMKFNLPKGNYFSENVIYKLEKPVVYLVPPVPHPEKNVEMRDLKIEVLPEQMIGGKARIDTLTGSVQLSEEIFSLPRPVWQKIFFHEIGHHLYYTEKYCDHFADLCLLKLGYNPLQLYKGSVCSLRHNRENVERFKYNHSNGMKIKQK